MASTSHHHHIVGSGAVGQLFACLLTISKIPNTLVNRASSSKSLTLNYFPFHPGEPVKPKALSLDCESIDDKSPMDVVWICVKSYQLEEALALLIPRLTANTRVILTQNGMGHLETAQKLLCPAISPKQLFVAVNTHGSLRHSDRQTPELHHTGMGRLQLGNNFLVTDNTAGLDTVLEQVGQPLSVSWHQQIELALWTKLGISAVINPLTAIYQCRNDDLITDSEKRTQADSLISEMIELYQAHGMDTLASSFKSDCYDVIHKTSDNFSSMMMDVKYGRQTEIESITGYLLSQANRVRLKMNGHQKQYHQIQKILNEVTNK